MAEPDNEPIRDDEDIRQDDIEYDPDANPPRNAKAWLNLLEESRRAFESYNDHCDKIEQRYASLMRLADLVRDKEFQMFWANMEVLKPSIYARPPIPVVVPKFNDRRPVPQAASEFLERCCSVAFDLTRIDDLMKLVRNDLAMLDRGVAWCRYEGAGGKSRYKTEKVCIDFKHRLDFLHSLSRNWREVTWVAAASYLTRTQARQRFRRYSGDEYQNAEYLVDRDGKEIGGSDGRERAKFWEIWDKDRQRVLWVADGCENILDEADPHLELSNFFPCPMPAYGTVQPGSLVPVPAALQYEDQLAEINLLTGRIHALSDALEAKGFYPAGTSEIADAVQSAIAHNTPNRVLVPISNWAAFGGTKEVIIWLPIDMIAQTITALVTLRKQIIEDIYQIMGLSDIMRGATDPGETLGAQQLKMQSGSARLRDKQQEIIRLARDLVEITADIITEKFDPVTMIEMSQTDLMTNEMKQNKLQGIMGHLMQLQQQAQQMQAQPEAGPPGEGPPDLMGQGQQAMMQGKAELDKVQRAPTIEQVLYFLGNYRSRNFVLDIQTDSTIQFDEQAEKQQRGEFLQALGNLLPQLSAMIAAEPSTAEFCGELLKFAVAPFRAGRSLDGAVDALVEQMKEKASMPPGDDPTTAQNKAMIRVEQIKDATNKQKIEADTNVKMLEMKQKDNHKKLELQNDVNIERMRLAAKSKGEDPNIARMEANQKMIAEREKSAQKLREGNQKLVLGQQKIEQARENHQQNMQNAQQIADEKRAQQQFRMMQPPGGRPVR